MGASVSSLSHGCLISSQCCPSFARLAARGWSQSADLAVTFKNAKLIVNLGAGLFKTLPFACSTFADIATQNHGALGLPDEGVFDCVNLFMETIQVTSS